MLSRSTAEAKNLRADAQGDRTVTWSVLIALTSSVTVGWGKTRLLPVYPEMKLCSATPILHASGGLNRHPAFNASLCLGLYLRVSREDQSRHNGGKLSPAL
jgi:hypothetical protein